MNKNFIQNIKKAYISPFAIVINALTLFFYLVMFFHDDLLLKLPIYIYIFIGFWVLINIIYFIQERNNTYKTTSRAAYRYIIVNILCGYSIPTALASVYVFGATVNGFEVFNYWLMIVGAMFLSWLGLHIILSSEFDISNYIKGNIFKLIGLVIKLAAFGLLIYLTVIVPSTQDENKFIWLSILIVIAIDLFIGRSYFNLSLFLYNKEGVDED
ncbi:DUF5079 family protein [Staphylococcus arlettae]|nr:MULTISPECIES: DUF5079 family protein [Staphylococcaceae]PTG42424.1 DUF5079 domain-containing protein [Staphylococcus cohnii]MCE7782235.1 DUF5079 family protein [Staphylococcus xylosus]PTG48925.1 DUF5079 domain-containing protein [Staphylococcus cohnii]PTH21171.1 DUF5079 domain-containing protein [Staphylococcus arlettae]PTH52588.1 DUF5079 domain-containing protein [Staphylococcus arlettae]